jgi:hypothetical protein
MSKSEKKKIAKEGVEWVGKGKPIKRVTRRVSDNNNNNVSLAARGN